MYDMEWGQKCGRTEKNPIIANTESYYLDYDIQLDVVIIVTDFQDHILLVFTVLNKELFLHY